MSALLIAFTLLTAAFQPSPNPQLFEPDVRVIWETRHWPEPLPQLIVTVDLIEELRPKPPIVLPVQFSPRTPHPIPPAEIEALLAQFFKPEDMGWALRISYCESHWDAHAANPRSSARGLFQAMEGWWGGASQYPAFDPYDPVANTRFAAWLFYHPEGGPSHWVCK